MFQIGEEDFSFGDDEEFWTEALEVEAATTASNSGKSVASSGSIAAENPIQQNHPGSCLTSKTMPPRNQGHPTQMPGQHLPHLQNTSNGLGSVNAGTLQVSNKDLPTTPGSQAKRKFSFKQKSPRGTPAALSIDTGAGANKRVKYDEPRPTLSNDTQVQVSGSLRPTAIQTSGARKLRQPLTDSSSTTERQMEDRSHQENNKQALQLRTNRNLSDKTRESQTSSGQVTGRGPTLPERANQNANLPDPGPKCNSATSKSEKEHLFDFGDNFVEEMDLSEDCFNWDPVIESSSTTSVTLSEPKPTFPDNNHSKQPNQDRRPAPSIQSICNISKPSSVSSLSLNSTPRYPNPNLTLQSSTSNANSTQLRPISTQGGSLRSTGQQNNPSSSSLQPAQLNNSTTRFSSPLMAQNPRPSFPRAQTQQLQGNPSRMNFQPRTPSASFRTPQPGTQYPLRTNTPMRGGTPRYSTPSPRFQGGGATRGMTFSPQTHTPNTINSTPRQVATPVQRFQNSASTSRGSMTQGDRPFTTHGAKPLNRGTPTPQTPFLTSRVAQLFQTPTTSSSGPTRTRVRKFPGPAGVLPKLAQGQKLNDIKLPSPENDPDKPSASSSKQEDLDSSQYVGETDFSQGAWQTMKTDLGLDESEPHSILAKNNIALVLRKASLKQLTKNKVPHLCVMIKTLSFDADASVVLKDPTGEIQGTVHRRVVEEHQSELKPGSVLLLRQVGVLSPSLRNHYLNITPSNLIQIYPSESTGLSQSSQRTPKPRSRHPSTNKEGLPGEPEQNTPKRPGTSETKNRSHSGDKHRTLVEVSPDSTISSLRRSSSGGRLTEKGKPASGIKGASSDSDLRLREATIHAHENHSLSSRLEGDATHSSTSNRAAKHNALVAKSCTAGAVDAPNPTDTRLNSVDSVSNAQKSEDFTELLADLGDDFFDDF